MSSTSHSMNRFLADVERRAFRMAWFAVGNRDDALDLVQDAMLKLVQRYARHDESEWPALFYTILQSRIRDWQRREKLRARFRSWFGFGEDAGEEDPIASVPGRKGDEPPDQLAGGEVLDAVHQAVQSLPLRQQQAFLLRAWEGLDTAQTAKAMACSEGSVKTHYARALQALRRALEEHRHEG